MTDAGATLPVHLPLTDMPVKVKLVADVPVNWFIGKVSPPGDLRVGDVDLVHVGHSENAGRRQIVVEGRNLQGLHGGCAASGWITERRLPAHGFAIDIVV